MTIAEAQRFYEQDSKKYNISKNKEFLTWFNNIIKNGYQPVCDIDDLQELINNITNWYEIKYPEREMEFYEGTRYFNFEDIKPLSKTMNIQQLLYRLPHKQLCLMECDYRSYGGGISDTFDYNGNVIGHRSILFMTIDKKNIDHNPFTMDIPYFLLHADTQSGKVDINYDLKDYVKDEDITLDQLLVLFQNEYSNELDFTKLEECVYDHNCDVELRRKILQLAALKLLYSQNTIPERGYERAKRFISEFNKKLNLNLSNEEIDEIFNRDYTNGEKWVRVLKNYTDNNGVEHSYWTVENVAEKENTPLEKAKQIVKTILKK